MSLVSAAWLSSVCTSIFEAAGVPTLAARRVAESLVEANLAGHDSHGVIRLPQYLDGLRTGSIDPEAQPELVRETLCTALIDGHWGFGQVVARWAMERAIEKAMHSHLSAVAVYHCNHIGRLGEYALLAAEQGMIGFVTCNAGRRVVPYGGLAPCLGTNPVAWALPGGRHPPFLLDFATSVVAEGKLRVARNRGMPVPPGWILDSNGLPTTDPADFYEGGMLLPAAEHKGYALALLADLLGGVLTGAGSPVLETYTGGNGTFMVVLDVGAFRPLAEFTAAADQLYASLSATPPAPGAERVLIPGEPELLSHSERSRHGIDIDESTWHAIQISGDSVDVVVPNLPSTPC